MGLSTLYHDIENMAFLEKISQEEPQESGLLRAAEGLAIPTMAGIGGYGLARLLGQKQWTGLPDWLVGPTFGIGMGVPLYRGAKRLGRRLTRKSQSDEMSPEYQAALEQELANQMALESSSREFLEQAMLDQMQPQSMGMMGPRMGAGKMKRANLVTKIRKAAAGSLSIPMDQVDSYYQNLAQQQAQKAQQAQQQQMQQAAVAQLIKGQFRGLQEQQKAQTRQLQKAQQQG